MRLKKKQFDKLADQVRLLSWAQCSVLYSDLPIKHNYAIISLIVLFWAILQCMALYFDGKGE